jgi:hypothetical protein
MKRTVQDWSIEKLLKERARISFPEYQRQPNLWSVEKKSLLIDSILQDIDIPKLYFFLAGKDSYEVVDGQQRLWAIWEFVDGNYSYKSNGTSKKFTALSKTQKDRIVDYKLQITLIENADDEYLRQLFLRLQLGLLLITGEKLHATTGAMKEFVFTTLASRRFIKELGIPARRFARETLCAQVSINSFTREKLKSFARTRFEDLQHFFKEYQYPKGIDLQFFREKTKKISSVVDELWSVFGERTTQLTNRSYILSVYLFFEERLQDSKGFPASERRLFVDFIFKLWKRLREEIRAGFDRKNKELYTFETYLSSAPGEKYQIERRHEKLKEYYAHFQKTGKIKGDP